MAAIQESKPRSFERNVNPTAKLMQNCDLPPPSKLYPIKDYSRNNEKSTLLKALRLSETRAREAERKLRIVSYEKEMLSNILVDELLRLFAFRRWVYLLELELRVLESRREESGWESCYEEGSSEDRCVEKSVAFTSSPVFLPIDRTRSYVDQSSNSIPRIHLSKSKC